MRGGIRCGTLWCVMPVADVIMWEFSDVIFMYVLRRLASFGSTIYCGDSTLSYNRKIFEVFGSITHRYTQTVGISYSKIYDMYHNIGM